MHSHERTPLSSVGKPIPSQPHAVSVALPKWQDVIDYEEGDPVLHSLLETGYPRFVFHPFVRQVFLEAQRLFSSSEESCLVLTSRQSAQHCLQFLHRQGVPGRIQEWRQEWQQEGQSGALAVVIFHKESLKSAKQYWQHGGEILSSRQAQAILEKKSTVTPADGAFHKENLRQRLAQLSGCEAVNVRLFPSGMAAITHTHRLLQSIYPGRKTLQLGFPYVDSLKVQEKFGAGVEFFPLLKAQDLIRVEELLKAQKIGAVFCEFPTNPLLQSIDLAKLSPLLRRHGVPLVLDDTINTFATHQFNDYADVLVSSLTKSFSGVGDVMGGTAIFNPLSPFYFALKESSHQEYEDLLWDEDAAVLDNNSQNFLQRKQKTDQTAEALCEYLRSHPTVAEVYYPKYITRENYLQCLRPGQGFGSLFSLVLKNGAQQAPAFYDHLQVYKGPSFGLNSTLACPYTLLAHYTELKWAEACGVSSHLVRISVGLEPIEILIQRFDEALSKSTY